MPLTLRSLAEIQSRLFDVGAAIATPTSTSPKTKATAVFPAANTAQVEEWIDALDAKLPPLKNFVIPVTSSLLLPLGWSDGYMYQSGGLCSTHLNLARAVCRRAERSCVALVDEEHVDPELGRYLNRLSDLLFVCVRFAAQHEGKPEILWRKS
jgi:cob(I)alamin adenosyltransferase